MDMIIFFAVAGMFVSLVSPACVNAHECRKEDTRLFGVIPFSLFGLFGYLLIALTAVLYNTYGMELMLAANHALIAFAGLFTIYLVQRARRIRLGCPLCFLVWILNAILFGLVIASYFTNPQAASPLV